MSKDQCYFFHHLNTVVRSLALDVDNVYIHGAMFDLSQEEEVNSLINIIIIWSQSVEMKKLWPLITT